MNVILLFSKDILNLSRVTVKTSIILQNINILNECSSFEIIVIK